MRSCLPFRKASYEPSQGDVPAGGDPARRVAYDEGKGHAGRGGPTLGVLIPLLGGFYYAQLLTGIHRTASRRGGRVVAFQTTGLEAMWPAEPGTAPLGWDVIDGWIGINDLEGLAYYRRIAAGGRPLVIVSSRLDVADCTILPDNHGGALEATRHLIAHGHRRIAFAGATTQTDIRERYDAYNLALREHGIEPDPALFFPMRGNDPLDGREVGRKVLAAGVPFTALVTGADTNALEILSALLGAGYRVPQDVAIVGFDDIEPSQFTSPPLSTVRQRFDSVGARAAEVLLDHLIDGRPFPTSPVRVPTKLIQRQSCGCKRQPARRADLTHALSGGVGELADALIDFITSDPTAEAVTPEAASSARTIARFVEAISIGTDPPGMLSLREAIRTLLGLMQDVETVEALHPLLAGAARVWMRRVPASDRRRKRVREGLDQLRGEIARMARVLEQRRRRYYDSVSEANRKINLTLTGADLDGAQALDWLCWTPIREASLGLWEVRDSARLLRVTSSFHSDAPPVPLLATAAAFAPEKFPPPELAARAQDLGGNHIVTVIPISGPAQARDKNRGLFTLVGPIETELSDNFGSTGQWAALLGAAMDREQLLESLREGFERERRFAATLRESEERYALAARGANDGLWDWDLVSGRVYYSARWAGILGCTEAELGARIEGWFARVHPDDLAGLRDVIGDHLAGRRSHIEHEYRMGHGDGSLRWVLARGVAVFDPDGRPTRIAGSQTDITGRKEAEERLRQSAVHDALTGLPNRTLLLDRLQQAIHHARRDPRFQFAVLYLDLDRFKTVNDSLGHLAGDQLLVGIANRLRESLRATDTVARLGGDEFALILTDLGAPRNAEVAAEQLQEALRAPFEIGGQLVFTSTSIGIAVGDPSCERADDFLRDADTAMYRAKTQGRARHEVFDARMHEQAMDRLRLEAELRHALERGEFLLYYQPIISLRTMATIGAEALLRWKHPDRGLMPPMSFVPVAEDTGLIGRVGEWVIRVACRQAREWRDVLGRPLRIAVNVSPQQLRDERFIDIVKGSLAREDLGPESLAIELVESSLIENAATTRHALEELQAIGVSISVDDFGTGYSSLSYVKRFPISALKIDRTFVQGIPDDANDTAISTAIIAMANTLHLTAVAEGVETREQAEFLSERGCDAGQGYHFSCPLSAAECLDFVRNNDGVARKGRLRAASAAARE